MNEEYQIGTKFIPVGRKNNQVRTVVDILKTYNAKNELVSIRYVSAHEVMGQIVYDRDVSAVTIARGILK